MSEKFGVLALARPTFDVPFAEETLARAFAALDQAGIDTVGHRGLCMDEETVSRALAEIDAYADLDLLLVLQVTFTDAAMVVDIAENHAENYALPLAIWAFPEPRLGGRLRLNAYCGLNLAAHALGRRGIPHGWLFAAPEAENIAADLRALAAAPPANPPPPKKKPTKKEAATAPPPDTSATKEAKQTAAKVMDTLARSKISVLGDHPVGFDTCAYDAERLVALTGIQVRRHDLAPLFDRARAAPEDKVAAVRERVTTELRGVEALDQTQLERSLRLFCALDETREQEQAAALAVRCWPETFTDYGCAACGAMAMLNQARTPCACEADVYGAASALILQELAAAPAWMADLVDLDAKDDSAVFWHCGLAPLSMRDPDYAPEATVHSNRKMPLLQQFPLKPGRVTIARLSQSRNEPKLVLLGGEARRAPRAFTGTSGVFRFDKPVDEVGRAIIEHGLEHHYGIAYGEHRPALRALAAGLDLPVLELT